MADVVSDTFTHLLQPDTLLPTQYFATLRRKGEHEPERRLVIAVLQDAVDCFQKHMLSHDRKARQLFLDAEEWICSSDRSWPFAFENVCDLLQINTEYLRRGLLLWKERELAALAERGRAKVVVLKPPLQEEAPQMRKAQAR
jgi:hypothetical protein